MRLGGPGGLAIFFELHLKQFSQKTRWLCVPALRPVCLERSRDHLSLIMANEGVGVTVKTTGKMPVSEKQ